MEATTMKREDTRGFEIQDHNIAAGYVTYIVDIWKGNRFDPAVDVGRYICVYDAEDLEDEDGNAVDPDFANASGRWGSGPTKPKRPVCWEMLETIKESSHEAQMAQSDEKILMGEGYGYGIALKERELFQDFMKAIEDLAADDTDESAWRRIEAWRKYNAHKHEK